MKQILLDFLEWIPDNINDIFELIDKPEDIVNKYLKDNEN